MNVLILVKNSEVGGVLSCTKSLVEGLEQLGHMAVVATCDGEGVEAMLKGKAVNIVNFNTKDPCQMVKNYRTLKLIIEDYKIDVIHAQNRIPALYASIIHFFNRKINYIWANHLVPIPSSFVYRLFTRYGCFAVAEGIEGGAMLVNTLKIPERKVKIVNLGCDLSQFKKNDERKNTSLKAKYSISKDEKVILLYGRLAPVKGHLFLLDAIEKLPECKRKKLKLIFPGENERYKEEIVSRAKEMQITNNIVFPGYIKGIDFLSISDLMVLPSKSEGFGIVNVESFALGVPVVRTKTAGYEDMKDYCFGVEYGDTDQLTMYINYLWDNQEVLNERAFYAKQNVSRFSMQAMAEGYIHIYEKCMSN